MSPRISTPVSALAVSIGIAGVLLTGCGNNAGEDPDPTATASPTATETETVTASPTEPTEPPQTEPTEPTTGTETSIGNSPIPDEDLPGESFTGYFSEPGATASVYRVAADDMLNVRQLPGADAPLQGQLDPYSNVILTGRERQVNDSVWTEIELTDSVGWVNTSYLVYIPDRGEDISEEFAELGPDQDHRQVAVDAAEQRADGEDPQIEWQFVKEPARAPLIYLVDITGMADDSVGGERLEILLHESVDSETNVSDYTVEEVHTYPLCFRGVSDGLCL